MECCNKKMKPAGYSYNPAERIQKYYFICPICGKKTFLSKYEDGTEKEETMDPIESFYNPALGITCELKNETIQGELFNLK